MTYPTIGEERVGLGCTIGWDSTGGTSYVVIGSVVDGDKVESKWKTANITLLSQKAERFSKTSYDPGQFKFTVIYDPLSTEYANLKTSFLAANSVAPNWQISFVDAGTGNGSGATTDTFAAHIIGLSRDVKKAEFLMCEITLQRI